MIEKNEFLEGIGKIANMTNTEPPKAIGTWYQKFKHWSKKEWVAACEACASELKWFPKVAEINERRPKNYSTGALAKTHTWLVEETIDEKGSPEIEQKIDSLTDDEIKWLFNINEMEASADFSIRMFRKNPDSRIYRGFIRDLVQKLNM